jgi:uncharacterized protein YjbI with pentapeptide repeats
MPNTIFEKCELGKTDFSYANLKNSSFHSATLIEANFFLTNLENTDFTDSTITDDQLQSALSIRNAKLPNGTIGKGRNLVKNGDANCNISLGNHWQVEIGNIAVVVFRNDRNQCRFSLQSVATGAIMSQRIALVDIWDSSFWTFSNVELGAQISNGVSIELIGKKSNDIVVDRRIASKCCILLIDDMFIFISRFYF